MVWLSTAAGVALRKVPEGWGEQRLAEIIVDRVGPPNGPAIETLRGGARVELDPTADRAQAVATMLRQYDATVVRLIVQQLPWGGVVFDADAHVGLVSLQVAAARFDATVRAFPCSPQTAQALAHNVALNPGTTVTAEDACLSDGVSTDTGLDATSVDSYMDEHAIASVDVLRLDNPGRVVPVLQGARSVLRRKRVRAIVVGAMIAAGAASPTDLLVEAGYRRLPNAAAGPQWSAFRHTNTGMALFVPRGSARPNDGAA